MSGCVIFAVILCRVVPVLRRVALLLASLARIIADAEVI